MSSTNEKVRLMRESDARLAAEKKNKPKLNKRELEKNSNTVDV